MRDLSETRIEWVEALFFAPGESLLLLWSYFLCMGLELSAQCVEGIGENNENTSYYYQPIFARNWNTFYKKVGASHSANSFSRISFYFKRDGNRSISGDTHFCGCMDLGSDNWNNLPANLVAKFQINAGQVTRG